MNDTINQDDRMKRLVTRCGSIAALAVASLASAAGTAHAQETAPCSYAECALRVRAAGFTSPAAIVRGQSDSVVITLPGFSARLADHFQRPDSAYYHALRFDTYNQRAFMLNIAGPLAFIVGSLLSDWGERPVSSALMMGGALGITVYGSYVANSASEELSRTIWWYNRELVETGRP